MDNKQITIIAICGMLMLLTLVFACSKGCGGKSKYTTQKSGSNNFVDFSSGKKSNGRSSKYGSYSGSGSNNELDDYGQSRSSHSSYRGGSSSYSSSSGDTSYIDNFEPASPPELLSEKEKAKMLKKREENRKKLRSNSIEWLKHKTNDPSLCIQTIEKYKIKSHQGFTNGTVALRNKDYNTAIKYFNETVKDANASPVTKYFALSNMMTIAHQTKDVKLYFIAARISAMLCATEDLSALGIKKDTHQLDWVEKVEKTIYARNDSKYFEECVKMKMDLYEGGVTREDAEADVRDDIAFYTNLYKEMLE